MNSQLQHSSLQSTVVITRSEQPLQDQLRSQLVADLISSGEYLLGRHQTMNIVLEDPTVSRRHARIVVRDGHVFITDLGSTNGTFVNNTPIIYEVEIRPGDLLRFGNYTLKVQCLRQLQAT
jgi:pSer/pThr/pTyr-binding forkhead associated (FHA) protein